MNETNKCRNKGGTTGQKKEREKEERTTEGKKDIQMEINERMKEGESQN